MPETTPSSTPAVVATPANLGENKGIVFHIKTGNARYACVLEDRSAYERKKAQRQNSTSTVASSSSSSTTGSI